MDVCELSENQLIVGDDSSTNRDSNIHEYHEESQSMVLHIYSSPMVDELIWDVLVRSKNLISFKQYDDDNTGASMKKKTLLFVDDTEEKDNFQNTTVGDSLALQPKRDRQPNGSPPIGKPQIEPTKINKTKTKGEKSSPSSISTRSRPWEPFSEGETCTPDALLHKATKLKTSFLHNFPEFHPNHIVCYFLFLPVENHVRYRFGIGLPWQTWHQTSSTLLVCAFDFESSFFFHLCVFFFRKHFRKHQEFHAELPNCNLHRLRSHRIMLWTHMWSTKHRYVSI